MRADVERVRQANAEHPHRTIAHGGPAVRRGAMAGNGRASHARI